MAKRFYSEVTAGSDLGVFDDPGIYNKTQDIADLAIVTEQQALANSIRTLLAVCNLQTLAEYDEMLSDLFDELSERIDYYDYNTTVKNTTVMTGAWFSPTEIQSVLGEDLGNEATKSIDGNNTTFWRDSTNHQHVIIFKLRDYPKKISKIRFRYGAGESARERLNNMDVHASKGIANIDNAENILETGINISWPVAAGEVWVEHTLATKKNRARFVKLVIDDTDNGQNQAQIREFEVWVETRDPGE